VPVYRRRNLFFTLGINYGLYALNKDEFIRSDGSDDGEWIEGIFNKNDGYLAPLTFVPFRERGQIRLHIENELASQRIIVMSILALSRHRQFPDEYKAVTLSYKFNPDYVEKKKREFLDSCPDEIIKGLKTEKLLLIFEKIWSGIISNEYHPTLSPEILATSYFYLAYKTIKICITYSDCMEILMKDLSDDKIDWSRDDTQRILVSNAECIIKWILASSNDHIALKIHQCFQMLRNSSIKYEDDIDLRSFVNEHRFRSYDDVMKELPPAFFTKDVYFQRVRRKRKYEESSWDSLKHKGFKLSTMSSGERQLLNLISYICYHIKNIQSIGVGSQYRIAYRYINVVLDEAELYFHPDLQRRFISMLLESLNWARINRVRIPAINFIIVTHSPFLLTDVFTENTLYLKDGQSCEVGNQTFGGNYYEILNNNFFFEKDSVGDVSARFIKKKIREKASGDLDPEDESISWIGDPFVTAYLQQPKNV